jgi:1,4-alpha-glucan branching enzyme
MTTPKTPKNRTTIETAELQKLLHHVHTSPHNILGCHPSPSGTMVRVYRPGADSVSVLLEDGSEIAMDQNHPEGLFEKAFPNQKGVFPYRLKVRYGKEIFAVQDPYRFMPTLGDMDLYLFNQGSHEELHEKFGAHFLKHQGVDGVSFSVWAPNAAGVAVVGDFNGWDGRLNPMRNMGSSGVWEIFIPDVQDRAHYKFEIHTQNGHLLLKTDPLAFSTEVPPGTAACLFKSSYPFKDAAWMESCKNRNSTKEPMSIYELHLGSWKRKSDGKSLSYRELAPELALYVKELGFTHIELMPIMEHPFGGSWGYQISAYFAPSARWGNPDDFKFFVDVMHQNGIGVILDWVPAHFPKDDWALGRFDGTALFEHQDPREGEHPDWGTYVFNLGRNEVRNFLISNALFWLSHYHIDGLRIDAVASMLYRDYSRKEGEWIPNEFGGRENLQAISFLRRLNEVVYGRHPGALMIAEESTAWPAVSRPTYAGGLGFGYKWNMGWMHDTLDYFAKEPIYRRYHHNDLTFGFLYAWSENFILPISHDEVVHGKKSLLEKMPGDLWQKSANLRSLFGYMWAHPGKKLLFMGCEFGQWHEWNCDGSLQWDLLQWKDHQGFKKLVGDLNRLMRSYPALYEADTEPSGFQWIDASNADQNVTAFIRKSPATGQTLLCACNFSPEIRKNYRVGLPQGGFWKEILNTDAEIYGGSNVGNGGGVQADFHGLHGQPCSASLTLPPLGVVWLVANP